MKKIKCKPKVTKLSYRKICYSLWQLRTTTPRVLGYSHRCHTVDIPSPTDMQQNRGRHIQDRGTFNNQLRHPQQNNLDCTCPYKHYYILFHVYITIWKDIPNRRLDQGQFPREPLIVNPVCHTSICYLFLIGILCSSTPEPHKKTQVANLQTLLII